MKTHFAFISSALLVAVGILQGCGKPAIDSANHLKDEANAANAAGQKLEADADARFQALFSPASIAKFPGNRAESEASARETAELYAKAVEEYRLGASKFDEAAKQDIDKAVAEYFAVWSQVLTKSAERRSTGREFSLLWLDKEIDTQEKFEARINEIQKRFEAQDAAVGELIAKAKKIETDNADKLD